MRRGKVATVAVVGWSAVWGIVTPICDAQWFRHFTIADSTAVPAADKAATMVDAAISGQTKLRQQCPATWKMKLELQCPADAVMLVHGMLGLPLLDIPGPLPKCAPAGCTHVPEPMEEMGEAQEGKVRVMMAEY